MLTKGLDTTMLTFLNLSKFNAQTLKTQPYTYLVLPEFIPFEKAREIEMDFPVITKRGSFPLNAVKGGAKFNQFIQELFSEELKKSFEEKYQISLKNAYPTITIRGQTGEKDGAVHTDSKSKIITILIYFNTEWDETKGRLRLLNSDDLNDTHLEVTPRAGTLISFLNSDTAWHGHLPFVGDRKAIQFNWVTSKASANMVSYRHSISAFGKKMMTYLNR